MSSTTASRPRPLRFALPASLAALVLATALPAFGQAPPPKVDAATMSAARRLMEDGLKLFDTGNFSGAFDKLSRADDLVKLPSTGLHLARTQIKLGRLVEASEKLLAVSRIALDAGASAVQRDAQRDAEKELAALSPRIPSLELALEPAASEAVVTLDGAPVPAALLGVPRPTNPGPHRVALEGVASSAKEITLAEGKSERVVLVAPRPSTTTAVVPALPPTSPTTGATTPSTQPAKVDATTSSPAVPTGDGEASPGAGKKVAAGVLFGVGGASLLAAGVLGIMTKGTVDDLVACTDDVTCKSADQEALYDKAVGRQTGAFVALGVGAALAATGGIVLALGSGSSDGSAKASASLVVSPTSTGFRFRW